MVSKVLVTTSLEETWPDNPDVPVLFLGEWCRLYSRRERWQKMNVEVIPYHWDDRNKLYNDYHIINRNYEELLQLLSNQLNKIHGLKHDLRYWRILIGVWLGYFLQVLFDRWYMLKYAIENYNISKVYVKRKESNEHIPNDLRSFVHIFTTDHWNEILYSDLLKMNWGNQVEIIEIKEKRTSYSETHKNQPDNKHLFKIFFGKLLYCWNKYLSFNDDIFFISTYIPKIVDLRLQIELGVIPKIWKNHSIPKVKVNSVLRKWELKKKSENEIFFNIACQLIKNHIPVAYLEAYEDLIDAPRKFNWPKLPKQIFTSNSFAIDDIFNAYAANKTEKGSKLIIGQHGGNYGMSKFSFEEEHQIKIADKWLSWGWKYHESSKIYSVGNFKLIGRNINYDRNGNALMIELTIPRYSYHIYSSPLASQWLTYHREQQIFLKSLPERLRKHVLLRFNSNDYEWGQVERWENFSSKLKFDCGKKDIKKLIRKSRLIISTYNATTYLESLYWNIPTIIFWKPEHWELNDKALEYLNLLSKNGIFHQKPECAAAQMIRVWDDIDSWWLSESVQKARVEFCKQFTNKPENIVGLLKKSIKNY